MILILTIWAVVCICAITAWARRADDIEVRCGQRGCKNI